MGVAERALGEERPLRIRRTETVRARLERQASSQRRESAADSFTHNIWDSAVTGLTAYVKGMCEQTPATVAVTI